MGKPGSATSGAAATVYRLEVVPEGRPKGEAFRTIEARSDQTLQDLHQTLASTWYLDAWKDYVFRVPGQAQIARGWEPATVRVSLAALGLKEGDRIFYSSGGDRDDPRAADEVRFVAVLTATKGVPAPGTYPRVVAAAGRVEREIRDFAGAEQESEDE